MRRYICTFFPSFLIFYTLSIFKKASFAKKESQAKRAGRLAAEGKMMSISSAAGTRFRMTLIALRSVGISSLHFSPSQNKLRRRFPGYVSESTASIYYLFPDKFRQVFSPTMQWQDCTVRKEIAVPTSVAYKCYSDREAIPQWMPFISSVKVLEEKPELSRWSLKYEAFGRDIEFAWLSRNMQPIPNQKIHWTSLEGLPNRGAVRFFPKGATACIVELTISYEVPQLLAPVASALAPFLESLLMQGLERFGEFAKGYHAKSTAK